MSRDGSNIYSAPAGTLAVSGTPIESAKYNAFVNDLAADANLPRPIVAGGTGASTAGGWLAAMGVTATAAELNTLDGITATVAELNVLDGIPGTLTATEIGYLDGVTSAIQTQLNAKQAAGATLSSLEGLSLVAGDLLYATAADTLARLAKGTAGQVLVMNAGATAPEWADGGTEWGTVETLTMTGLTVTTSDFEEGYDYRFLIQGWSHDGVSATEFSVSFYGVTAAAYSTAVIFTEGNTATNREHGEYILRNPRGSQNLHVFQGISYRNSTATTSNFVLANEGGGRFGAMCNWAAAQGILRLRFAVNGGDDFDLGTLVVQRKR